MNPSELSRVIEAVGKDRGIKKEVIIDALEQAVLTAAQKSTGSQPPSKLITIMKPAKLNFLNLKK